LLADELLNGGAELVVELGEDGRADRGYSAVVGDVKVDRKRAAVAAMGLQGFANEAEELLARWVELNVDLFRNAARARCAARDRCDRLSQNLDYVAASSSSRTRFR